MSTISRLYDQHYREQTVDDLVNGFREHADRLTHVMTKVKILEPESILDIACNRGLFGRLVRWRHGYFPRYVAGVDCSMSVLDEAKAGGYDAVHELDVRNSFDLKRYFDLVLCMEILEHVPNPDIVIMNAFRHARKDLLFSVPEEHGDVDGTIHVAHITLDELTSRIHRVAGILNRSVDTYSYLLPSAFCEKPRWQGWNFVEVHLK